MSKGAVMNTYQRFPLTIKRGEGSYIWDDNENKYLDLTMGIATCNLGHVPKIVKTAVENQLEQLWHCSNLYEIPAQQQLADLIVSHSVGDQVFFSNSGAEANEAAIKLARKYAKQTDEAKSTEIVTFKQSFHGRTVATMSATGQEKVQEGFDPLAPGFRTLTFNDRDALESLAENPPCAVMLELVQGEGGVVPAHQQWVQDLASLCQDKGILLMIDEIQTGIGRTGTLFAYEQYGIEPDVFTLAKGLGSGFPIGATVAKQHVSEYFSPGSHGSTFGGNPLAVTAAKATIEHIIEADILTYVEKVSIHFRKELEKLAARYNTIESVRGCGLLLGLAVNVEAKEIITLAREKGLLVLPAGPTVVRLLPALTISYQQIEEALSVLDEVFAEAAKKEATVK
ncbi:acetylornithine transaminase [Texcoconibacillus texcoconensis]|uniref:Acetylornithine aminotransferase n=1 Tax=Texcoconibacillus texcoconensis TaxID=1095777 RepID=A0A840QS78_9BACI|nr:acetylornithine transaminase [Texcoconibacillus texcoconensis]MBB5174173.1 acetylornithine aminotransferase [Texcoconibacillus texcoconensis]